MSMTKPVLVYCAHPLIIGNIRLCKPALVMTMRVLLILALLVVTLTMMSEAWPEKQLTL